MSPLPDLLVPVCLEGDFARLGEIAAICVAARERAQDEAVAADFTMTAGTIGMIEGAPAPGCVLLQPPMIGINAVPIIRAGINAAVPFIVLCREPLTLDGLWPIAAAGQGMRWPDERRGPPGGLTVRVRVEPPEPVTRVDSSPTRDAAPTPPPAWFLDALDALDQVAMSRIEKDVPGAHRVRTIIELLDAHPLGTELYRSLQEACAAASVEPSPEPRDSYRK